MTSKYASAGLTITMSAPSSRSSSTSFSASRALFRGIRKNRNVFELMLVQNLADGAHASVHHVRRGDDVGSGTRVRQRLLGKNRHRGIIRYFAILDDATVAMVRIFAKAY